ncbi:type ISP restriction/modification enzyme [Staphylococcus haemolyticus]|uniref:type ISP restriction/modification enzyme n=1 Tax=Staphylococcus haemolyticus TaxID=1283 RepID=UPI00190C707F|nr:type ISP restriction/modification enzyme [Staphylococcus haemolyticus]MBK3949363.1 DEAD/DEAH box helicase [Staphylococcus haemolyticus]
MKNDSFFSLIKKMDNNIDQQRDRGTLFERLCIAYLKNEPLYSNLFDEVWMLNEVPDKYEIPKVDTGVDLVAKKNGSEELTAIQCKYYSEKTTIRKAHIDSFLNEVGKKYYTDGLIITTTDKWSKNADDALNDRNKKIMRLSLSDLHNSKIDWSTFNFGNSDEVKLLPPKTPRKHQIPAIEAVVKGFEENDRGKLIMAPGTGKTYTSMAITEKLAESKNDTFKVLYLVPSIQLLSQTLKSWNADISVNMKSIAVCSDRKVTKQTSSNKLEDISSVDIGFPATTNKTTLLQYMHSIENKDYGSKIITVFSTYQSIGVISEAQKDGFYNFDLVICDEAHRTTGATEVNKEASAFTMVHSNNNIKANKRLYQTATPRVYGESAKKKADEKSVLIADMADEETYGKEFYRIGFGDAIRKGILTDYKVMVLAVDEDFVFKGFQEMIARNESEIGFDDVTKIIGCWNGLVKRDGNSNQTLGQPMKRAIAFTGTIKESKKITEMFSKVVDEYLYNSSNYSNPFRIDIDHADGSMNAVQKNSKIDWLKSEVPENTCRVLSNARFLTEGIDIPDLDAIMFLKPRRSKIDIAQAVGRVMRKAEGKDYGYIILPIGVPSGTEAHTVLDNNEKYQVVWEILNALRSIDERFDAIINKLELNKKKPDKIQIIGVGEAPEELEEVNNRQEQLTFSLDEEHLSDLERAIYGKIVNKVGNVKYWEQWSKDVAEIARKHVSRIRLILEKDKNIKLEFEKFVKNLRYNINNSIDEKQVVEMLSQHMITKPIFEALFDNYSFVKNNPVSTAMEKILDILGKTGIQDDQKKLDGFYESVRARAEGIDNLEAKQKIIIQLYNKFFKNAFPETTDELGIVFTPIEVVDFIINSTEDLMNKYFNISLSDKNVNILDPFTGTGTFIVRLLQSGIIKKEDLIRKYTKEIFANEIILLSYYIAVINIEETLHMMGVENQDYIEFKGITLTDTFDMTEKKDSFDTILFSDNNNRINQQLEKEIDVIIGNPPYSVSKKVDANNNRLEYPILDTTLKNTYIKNTEVRNKNSLYDSYIRAFRWASNRIKDKGIISFVTNGQYLDSRSASGIRESFHKEFNYVYIYNLRGDQRTVGEESKKEGGKIFGSGSRTPIAITYLIKDGSNNHEIYYKDIGDYLNQEEKLNILKNKKSILNVDYTQIIPDKYNDWLKQRNDQFNKFISIYDSKNKSIYNDKSTGVTTGRDMWVTGFSKKKVLDLSHSLVEKYNIELKKLENEPPALRKQMAEKNDKEIKWDDNLYQKLEKGQYIELDDSCLIEYLYRPFTKKYIMYDSQIIQRPRKFKKFWNEENSLIYTSGPGAKVFSVLSTNMIPDKGLLTAGQGFYSLINNHENLLKDNKYFNINEQMTDEFSLNAEHMIYYIYGVLHSEKYLEKYGSDLSKVLPKIPNLVNKELVVDIGKYLFTLHSNYEEAPIYKGVDVNISGKANYQVKKMKFENKKKKDTIIFNEQITISNIPKKAYSYKLAGKSAIEWIMDQYQIKKDSKSQIVDDPNEYSEDETYILNLLLKVIYISVKTVEKIEELDNIDFDKIKK